MVSGTPLTWEEAKTYCEGVWSGAHLVTSSGTSADRGIMEIIHGDGWVGAFQTSKMAEPGGYWAWVDSTPATNLLCSFGPACLWLSGEPNNQGGLEDRATVNRGGLNDFPALLSKHAFCEVEVDGGSVSVGRVSVPSSSCPDGWTLFENTAGAEPAPRCFKVFEYQYTWSEAVDFCQSLAPDVTLATSPATDLATSIVGAAGGGDFWVWASQTDSEYFGPTLLGGWSWGDSTPASNLGCGSQGCNLWRPFEPNDFSGRGSENCAGGSGGVGLNDKSCDATDRPLCMMPINSDSVVGDGSAFDPNAVMGSSSCCYSSTGVVAVSVVGGLILVAIPAVAVVLLIKSNKQAAHCAPDDGRRRRWPHQRRRKRHQRYSPQHQALVVVPSHSPSPSSLRSGPPGPPAPAAQMAPLPPLAPTPASSTVVPINSPTPVARLTSMDSKDLVPL